MTTEFESWATGITEETWDSDSDDQDEQDLIDLAQTPIRTGVDGVDAMAALDEIHFLDSDELKNALYKLSRSQGPDADARQLILGWLMSNGETVLAKAILTNMQNQNASTQQLPVSPTPAPQPTGASTMDAPVVNEDIAMLKWLSGLSKK